MNVKLKLNLGDPKKEIFCTVCNSSRTLTFDYPLSVNDSALGLNYNSVDSLTGEVKDKANNSSSLKLPEINSLKSLAGSRRIVIGKGWEQQSFSKPYYNSELDRFGNSISLSGDFLAVGAARDDASSVFLE